MTHDELLLDVSEVLNWYEDQERFAEVVPYLLALQKVVELHKPHEHIQEYGSGGLFCFACQLLYPCFTIQAIEKVLAHSTES